MDDTLSISYSNKGVTSFEWQASKNISSSNCVCFYCINVNVSLYTTVSCQYQTVQGYCKHKNNSPKAIFAK